MTMKRIRSIAAGEFKAKCLEVLNRVARDGSSYVVTKRGRPVARVVPVEVAIFAFAAGKRPVSRRHRRAPGHITDSGVVTVVL